MNLNKKGWSIVTELVVILIAVILLVYSIYGVNKMGLLRKSQWADNVKPELIIKGKKNNYGAVETELIEASKKYIWEKYDNDFIGEEIILRISHLNKSGYLSTIRDLNNKECSGYVKINKGNLEISYSPYLKCNNYISEGYESEYDW